VTVAVKGLLVEVVAMIGFVERPEKNVVDFYYYLLLLLLLFIITCLTI
jgi:hypothetical protein